MVEEETTTAALRDGEEERLLLLAETISSLLGGRDTADLVPAILSLSQRLFAAEAYAVWRRHPVTGEWQALADLNLSASYPRSIPAYKQSMLAVPLCVEDVLAEPLLAERQAAYLAEGIRSMLCVPLYLHGDPSGTITFYYRQPRSFDPAEVRLATALATLAATAITTRELYEKQQLLRAEAEQAQQRLAFLAKASSVLASSLDHATTLEHVANLVVPHLADWCTVHVVDEQGSVQQVAVTHADPAKVKWAREIQERYPYDPDEPRGIPQVLRTGQTELYPEITDEMLVAAARNADHLQMLRQVGFTSCMIVPLAARSRVLGAITFIGAESGFQYGDSDVALAEDLARRAAAAIDNSHLYQEALAAQEALRQRAEALAEADRQKDEFLALLGHELRTPLAAIHNSLQLVQRRSGDDTQRTRLHERVERQIQRMGRLVDDLQDLSRLTRRRLTLRLERLDLVRLVREIAEDQRGAMTDSGLTLSLELPGEPILVDGDPIRLGQVVVNLLNNATKFTDPGGRVTVQLSSSEEWAAVGVKDTGIGIEPELLPRVFETFTQAERSLERSRGGLGLGLALVKGFVELHAGEVRIWSAGPGQGTEVTFRLPVARSDET